MSSTVSSAPRPSAANGADLRSNSSRSSTVIGSIAQIATICWAAMSSGFAITASDSIAPICIRPATTAAEIRSPRNFGNITPWLGAPT